MQATISSAALLDLYEVLNKEGIVSSDIESLLGYSPEQLNDVALRVPVQLQDRLWDLAMADGAKPNIGLLVGTQINTKLVGILSQLLIHSANLREALNHFSQHIALMNQCEKVTLQKHQWGCRLIYKNTYPQGIRISEIERSVSAAVTWASRLSGTKVVPIRVGFPFSKVAYFAQYHEIFGEEVMFDQAFAFIDIANTTLDLPVKTANEFIKEALIAYIDRHLDEINQTESSLYSQVKHLIAEGIKSGAFSSDDVALKLNMSRQTLHRKLTQEDTNFRLILAEVRKEKVMHFLISDQHVFDEISEALGFKEPSAFYRAFKSWFNMTPNHYRQLMKQRI
jgi:AraC-like DNA-binding protein